MSSTYKPSGLPTRQMTTPIETVRSRRRHQIRNMTSLPAGKTVPIAVIPLLREDAASVSVQMAFEMQETVEILLNGVNVDVHAWLVPTLASPRFRSMDDVNLAYTGNPREAGGDVVPWFETAVAGEPGENEIHMRLGKHAKATDEVNMAYVEAYNLAWNFRASEVSPNIPLRERLETSLAQAFWSQNTFSHIVPDFDQAVMEGEVALNIASQGLALKGPGGAAFLPVRGDGVTQLKATGSGSTRNIHMTAGATTVGYSGAAFGATVPITDMEGLRAELAGAVAELADNGVTVSLSNIDMARKAQVFANIRKRYNGLSEDMLIDLLMDGMTIPEQGWKQPILLHHGHTQFGMAKRYASNGEALTESVVNGAAALSFRVATPRVPCGGVIIVTAEISPEQLFERQEDPYLHARGVGDLPAYTPDFLDPEKVEAVPNRYIDIDHDDPDSTYGYAPLNYRWNAAAPNIGGRFFRPEVDAEFDEDRQALWAVETQNPTLTADAYLVPEDIHLKPFWTSTIDPFDCITLGGAEISGNTVFGGLLIEATAESDYDAVLSRVDQERIDRESEA